MKKILIGLVIFLFSINLFPDNIDYEILSLLIEKINIDFSLFPTKNRWNGNLCVPILNTQNKKNYQTIIKNASEQEPNFDGKYRIVTFGTGSTSQNFFIIDLNNGNVYERIGSTHGIKYELNSSLIIINDPEIVLKDWNGWDENIPDWINVEYLWENNYYKKILLINP